VTKGVVLFLIAAALLQGACRDSRLDVLAQRRVEQLEACLCASHDGFTTVTPEMQGVLFAEVVAATLWEASLNEYLVLWMASPPHRSALTEPDTPERWGYARSKRPAANGYYYAVMLTERD